MIDPRVMVHQLADGRWFVGSHLRQSNPDFYRVPLIIGGTAILRLATIEQGGSTPLYLRQNVAIRSAAKLLDEDRAYSDEAFAVEKRAVLSAATAVAEAAARRAAGEYQTPRLVKLEGAEAAEALEASRPPSAAVTFEAHLWRGEVTRGSVSDALWSSSLEQVLDFIRGRLGVLVLLALGLAAGCSTEAAPTCDDGRGFGLVISPCAGAPDLATCARETASGSRAPGPVDCSPQAGYGAAVLCVAACPESSP